RGRGFTAADRTDSQPVAIVNAALARHYWPGEDPLGKRLRVQLGKPVARTIVGVVADVKHAGLGAGPRDEIYLPYDQLSARSMRLVLRTSVPPATVLPATRRTILEIDSEQPVGGVVTMDDLRQASLARDRFSATILAFFALVGVGLAAMGIYAIMTQSVAQSSREIGLRMALGASPPMIASLLLGRGLRLIMAGLGLGLVIALPLASGLERQILVPGGVEALLCLSVAALLAAIALLAIVIPARRAAALDPTQALREN
ncbi:MAG: ABC transporter permease, partial [Acidobacteria bacterium]|nr:ABC transporter permease [Acidobacteriota bacterium]